MEASVRLHDEHVYMQQHVFSQESAREKPLLPRCPGSIPQRDCKISRSGCRMAFWAQSGWRCERTVGPDIWLAGVDL